MAEYLNWNCTAAVQELAEVREEFSWKPWAKDEPFVNRERVRDEIIDALHFLGNMLTVMGVTDEELAEAYQRKQEINRQRAASGTYSAKKGGLSEGSDVR
jgi:dimeric dUTPase (all-alpha-NTP-PPase superfamily)